MNEQRAMAMLSEANPVRAGDLSVPDPSLVDRVVALRRRPSRRVTLVAAIIVAALAASLVAVFATGGHKSSGSIGSMEATIGPPPTVAYPLPGGKEVTLGDAAVAVGRPLVLPDTRLVNSSAVSSVWVNGTLPGGVAAAVTFPSAGIFIEYTVPGPRDPSATYQAIARENPRSFETIDLNGETALVVKQNTDDTGHNFGGVVFVRNGVEIRVFGHYDTPPLRAVAQSIIDRSEQSASTQPLLASPLRPSPHVGSAAAAQATVPFKLVLPSRARPLVIVVSPKGTAMRKRGVGAFFDTPAAGPFYVSESLAAADTGEGIRTVADLRRQASSCHSHYLCPVHKIVRVHGVPVLVIGAPGKPGGLTLFWLRGHGRDAVLTWMQGPEDNAHGDLRRHVFRPNAALAVAADMIAHGG